MIRVTEMDHVVVRVDDTRRALAWYADKLGLEPMRVAEWERGEVLFASVRINADTIIDLLEGERTGTNIDHVCLVLDADALAPGGLEALAESGEFDVLGPPAELFGARGVGRSLYVRDPDGNVVELRHY
jgi:catechol 2,3-dioxygenase-like lactoylglutathione lyase family enzyme